MVFNDDLATGGPGTLAKDFGEITLTGAAALRTLTSSWTAAAGAYWAAVWMQLDSAMNGITPFNFQSAAGFSTGTTTLNLIGNIGGQLGVGSLPVAHYVDTTYGAAPATAVTPTATASSIASATPVAPVFFLKA